LIILTLHSAYFKRLYTSSFQTAAYSTTKKVRLETKMNICTKSQSSSFMQNTSM